MRIVKTVEDHYILQDGENRFWGIPKDCIKNNRTTREFNGISGLMSETIEECENRIRDKVKHMQKLQELQTQGVPPLAACLMIHFGLSREEAERRIGLYGLGDA